MMKSLITSALALAALSAVGTAQSKVSPLAVQGTPGHATINMATGELTRDTQDKAATLVTIWTNTDTSGYYSTWSPNPAEWLDWGVISTTSGSDIVGQYSFGYATTSLDTSVFGPGASLCTNFYAGTLGFCAESGAGVIPVANGAICWSGLPGTTTTTVAAGWLVTVTLTGGFEFQLGAGPFGYGMTMLEGTTGPLLCYAGNGAGGADGNGQIDVFDVYVPDVASGTCGSYFFGGVPFNFSSWYLWIATADGTATIASCTFYCGSNINAGGFTVNTNAVLGGNFTATVVHARALAILYAYASSLTFPYKGMEILINFLDPGGELLGGPAVFGSPANFSLAVPINLAFCGFAFYVQAVSVGGGITLHCAYACVIGF